MRFEGEETITIGGDGKSHTFRGTSKITTSGVPIRIIARIVAWLCRKKVAGG